MSANVKAALKKAKEALNNKDYKEARLQAETAMRHDVENYQALVFYALACDNLGSAKESEDGYRRAIEKQPDFPVAWQGLANLHEKIKSPDTCKTWERLLELYAQNREGKRYLELVPKLASRYVDQSDPLRAVLTWKRLLPDHDKYSELKMGELEDRPSEAEIWRKILDLTQSYERERIQKEISTRKFRLGAPPIATIKFQVESEVFKNSELEVIYNRLLGFDLEDVVRHKLTADLMEHLQRKLLYVPGADKLRIHAHLRELAQDAVSKRGAQDPGAVEYLLHTRDIYSVDDLDTTLLTDYAQRYPSRSFAKLVKVILDWKSDLAESIDALIALEDELKDSLLRLVTLAEAQFLEGDLNGTIVSCRSAADILDSLRRSEGLEKPKMRRKARVLLAKCYTESSDKEVMDAVNMFQDILVEDPHSKDALFGLARAHEKQGKFQEATEYLTKLLELDPENKDAKFALSWALFNSGHTQESLGILTELQNFYTNSALYLYRLGRVNWSLSEENRRDKSVCFKYFVDAARIDPDFDQPFIYLGHFYSQYENDMKRAKKCYQKSFDINASSEVGKILAGLYENAQDSDSAFFIYETVVKQDPRAFWAWKRMAAYHRSKNEMNDAIIALQAALRCDIKDVECWNLLAISYQDEGRFVASLKAFERVLELDPCLVTAHLNIGIIKRRLGLYSDALATFELVKELKQVDDVRIPLTYQIARTYYVYARDLIDEGSYGQAADDLICAINAICSILEETGSLSTAWKLLGDCFIEISRLPAYVSHVTETDFEQWKMRIKSKHPEPKEPVNSVSVESLLTLGAWSFSVALQIPSKSRHHRATCWFSHAISLYRLYEKKKTSLDVVTKSIKTAIKLEPNNSTYWNALGVFTATSETRLSQHCFIKAIELNSNNSVAWSNLGLLYLMNEDLELATQAFTQAQTVDPDYPIPWLVSAITKDALNPDEALQHYQHSMELTCGSLVDVNYGLASSLFEKSKESMDALFAMQKYVEQQPDDINAVNLYALILERVGFPEVGAQALEKLLPKISVEEERVVLLSNAARLHCNAGQFEKSLQRYGEIPASYQTQYTIIGKGLASFFAEKLEVSMDCFQVALDTCSGIEKAEVTVLLSQVLHALGTQQHLDAARQLLLGCFGDNPDFIPAIKTLIAMGVVHQDWQLALAALQEALNLPFMKSFGSTHGPDLDMLSAHILSCQGNNSEALQALLKSARLNPYNSDTWSHLADFLSSRSEIVSDQAITSIFASLASVKSSPEAKSLVIMSKIRSGLQWRPDCAEIVELTRQSESLLRHNPYSITGWVALACCLRVFLAHLVVIEVEDGLFDRLVNKMERVLNAIGSLAESTGTTQFSQWKNIMDVDLLALRRRYTKQEQITNEVLVECVQKLDGLNGEIVDPKLKSHCFTTMARCLSLVDANDQAVACYQAAYNLQHDLAPLLELARVLSSSNATAQAIELLKQSLENASLEQTKFQINLLLADLALKSEDFDTALTAINEALKLDASSIEGRLCQAIYTLKKGSVSKALKLAQTGMTEDAEQGVVYGQAYWLSQVFEKKGDSDQAAKWLHIHQQELETMRQQRIHVVF